MHTIDITTDELGYMLELLNNERYTGNTNVGIADTLFAALHEAYPIPNDEEIEAQIAHHSMMTMVESERGQ